MMLSGKAKIFRRTHLIIGEAFTLEEFYGEKLNDKITNRIDEIIRLKMIEQQVILLDIIDKKKKKQ